MNVKHLSCTIYKHVKDNVKETSCTICSVCDNNFHYARIINMYPILKLKPVTSDIFLTVKNSRTKMCCLSMMTLVVCFVNIMQKSHGKEMRLPS